MARTVVARHAGMYRRIKGEDVHTGVDDFATITRRCFNAGPAAKFTISNTLPVLQGTRNARRLPRFLALLQVTE
jgi:hypothetical protein